MIDEDCTYLIDIEGATAATFRVGQICNIVSQDGSVQKITVTGGRFLLDGAGAALTFAAEATITPATLPPLSCKLVANLRTAKGPGASN
jgi:hypothetical protein